MNMKNKKGFTLIELLAVIVILAIIMVIATMQVNKTIKKARQDSFALSFKSLKKQIQQRIVTGEEYLCYDSVRGNEKISNRNDFFGNQFDFICGTGTEDVIRKKNVEINGKLIENVNVTGTISDYGVSACQDIYDISDDYRMWVYYQASSGDVFLLLNTTDGKFKGTPYIQGVVENIGGTKMAKSSTLGENLEIEYKDDKLAGKSISMGRNEACKYNAYYNHFGKNSYECFYQWNKSKIPNIKAQLEQEADKNDGKVTIGEACKILTNSDNWN